MILSMLFGLESPVATWNTSRGSFTQACAETASITEATWSTGVISRINFSLAGINVWPFLIRKMMGAVVVKPSFQPGNGYDRADSTILGLTILRTIAVSAATNCSPSDFV